MSDDAIAQGYVDRLVAELERRGLRAAGKRPALTVKDPALTGVDRRGQQVLIRNLPGKGFTWCWVWPGLRPATLFETVPPHEIEPMCPASDIERAADLITNVVRLRSAHIAVPASGS